MSTDTLIMPYAYSFNRDTFQGEFATREQAIEAGLKAAAARVSAPPTAVYVGKRVPTDPQADGHAEEVVKSMRQRMLDRAGDSAYLAAAHEHALADLDAALARAIGEWLTRNDFGPAAKVKSISEHPLPLSHEHGPSSSDEVQLMGGEFE